MTWHLQCHSSSSFVFSPPAMLFHLSTVLLTVSNSQQHDGSTALGWGGKTSTWARVPDLRFSPMKPVIMGG